MKKRNLINFGIALLLFIIFIIYTIIVLKVDVASIGPNGSTVGLSTLNKAVFDALGVNNAFYTITDYLGYITILVAGTFAVIGFGQLIKRKSFKKIDIAIILLGILYIIVIVFYVLFEKVAINYRPVLVEDTLEASYPSTHTILALVIMITSIFAVKEMTDNKKINLIVLIVAITLSVIIVIGRLLSGIHWVTDIIGGVILSSSLIMGYYATLKYFTEKKA